MPTRKKKLTDPLQPRHPKPEISEAEIRIQVYKEIRQNLHDRYNMTAVLPRLSDFIQELDGLIKMEPVNNANASVEGADVTDG